MLPEMLSEDTIAAVSTPPGRGGIGIVRLSGERALAIAGELIRWGARELAPQRAVVGEFVDPEAHPSAGRSSEGGAVLDQV
ncbi:MAG: tRNA uridine-5-carboxymethylaminomethyl(34) synthesis GTPase MnmE, partial [Acidobacteria bacterium]|nr:tRNA uridine-5-carboxymethylaminomethyl(34) synthesis GTPase MnmE [Acidobacteriota bacterium]